jgi:hypothetical protein
LLTDNTRYRSGFFGGLVLQVEDTERKPNLTIKLSPFIDRVREFKFWRDADLIDLQELERLDQTLS